MNVNEARALKVGDIIIHKFLKTEWIIIEANAIKANKGKFRHKLQQKDSVRRQTFTEKGLHLWITSL